MNDTDLRRLIEPDQGLLPDRHVLIKEQMMATILAEQPACHDRSANPKSRSAHRRRYRGIVTAATVGVAALGLVAWNTFDQGEIERIPTEAALMSGQDAGYLWWLVPSEAIGHANPCGVPFPGVEMVSAATNKPGQEWNTGGVNYGENIADERGGTVTYDCTNPRSDFNEVAWLNDPTLLEIGFARLGRDNDSNSPWAGFVAMHPSIEQVDVTVDGKLADTVETVTKPAEPNGVRYAGFTIDARACDVQVILYASTGGAPTVVRDIDFC
jgi:hypothetical protein